MLNTIRAKDIYKGIEIHKTVLVCMIILGFSMTVHALDNIEKPVMIALDTSDIRFENLSKSIYSITSENNITEH